MKLEVKHILPYIEHNLDVRIETENGYRIDTVAGLFTLPDKMITFIEEEHWFFNTEYNDFNIKPILRPLSDLREKEWYEKFGGWSDVLNKLSKGRVDFEKLCYSKMALLFKHNFDIFGLIDKGLAVNYKEIYK